MVEKRVVDSDFTWIDAQVSLLLRDLSLTASAHTATYNTTFLQHAKYVQVNLHTMYRDYHLWTDARYYAHLRLLLEKIAGMLKCVVEGHPALKAQAEILRRGVITVHSHKAFADFRAHAEKLIDAVSLAVITAV